MANQVHLELYTGNKTYLAPAGKIYDRSEVLKDFPAAARFQYVVETDAGGETMGGFHPLSTLRSKWNIDNGLSDQEAVEAVEAAMNAARAAQEEAMRSYVSAEERTAAALEFLAMSNLPDEEV